MRVHAVVLGLLLTAGSAYVAQLAVASAGFERVSAPSPKSGDMLGPGELWYGGVIEPVTVEAMREASPAVVVAARQASSRECLRLTHPNPHPRRPARACDRAWMDSMM